MIEPTMSTPLPPLPRIEIETLVARALAEDIGRGDVTTDACVPRDRAGHASFVAREALIVAGLDVVRETFAQVDPALVLDAHVLDGARVAAGATIASVHGGAHAILMAERVALNFAQRLSGVATLTRAYVDARAPGATTRITDTRKTTPGLRVLERHAVRCGGGHNHRNDLSAAVLIKDNHIAAAGGITTAIERARAFAPHTSRIECEVDSLDQLEEALAARAEIILLDNFDDGAVKEAVARNRGRALLEVSGGVTLARIASLSKLGVDAISVGALTHSARAVDIGLDWASD